MQSPERPSPFGMISIFIAIMNIVIWCAYATLFTLMINEIAIFDMDGETLGYLMVFAALVLIALSSLLFSPAGIILGFIAMQKHDAKRSLAIAGLILNTLGFAPCCLLVILISLGQTVTAIAMP